MAQIPPEIWKECFYDSGGVNRSDLKALSTVSRQLHEITQPLWFRDLEFVPEKFLFNGSSLYGWSADRSVFSFFTYGGTKPCSIEGYTGHLVRGKRRFELVAANPRLAAFVKTCLLGGPGSKFPTRPRLSESPGSLADAIRDLHNQALTSICVSLKSFSNLRSLTLSSMAVTQLMLRNLEQIPQLEELTMDNCTFFEKPEGFHPRKLSKMTTRFCDFEYPSDDPMYDPMCVGRGPILTWGACVTALLPIKALEHCIFDISAALFYPPTNLTARPLADFGPLELLHTLAVPLPRSHNEALFLLDCLANTPNLRCLKLSNIDLHHSTPTSWDMDHTILPPHAIPPVDASIVSGLEELTASIEWAKLLVPGRPIRILRVFRVLISEGSGSESNEYYQQQDPEQVLHTFTSTTSRIEELRLPCIGDDEPVGGFNILGVVGRLFPHLKSMWIRIWDEGVETFPVPTPPSSPRPQLGRPLPRYVRPLRLSDTSGVPARREPFKEPDADKIQSIIAGVCRAVEAELNSVPNRPHASKPPVDRRRCLRFPYTSSNDPYPSGTPAEVTYPITTFPGAIYHAAAHPEDWPLPKSLEVIRFVQVLPHPRYERYGMPFYPHQERKILDMLAAEYPELREVVWIFDAHLEQRRHRWRRVGGEWVICPGDE